MSLMRDFAITSFSSRPLRDMREDRGTARHVRTASTDDVFPELFMTRTFATAALLLLAPLTAVGQTGPDTGFSKWECSTPIGVTSVQSATPGRGTEFRPDGFDGVEPEFVFGPGLAYVRWGSTQVPGIPESFDASWKPVTVLSRNDLLITAIEAGPLAVWTYALSPETGFASATYQVTLLGEQSLMSSVFQMRCARD